MSTLALFKSAWFSFVQYDCAGENSKFFSAGQLAKQAYVEELPYSTANEPRAAPARNTTVSRLVQPANVLSLKPTFAQGPNASCQ